MSPRLCLVRRREKRPVSSGPLEGDATMNRETQTQNNPPEAKAHTPGPWDLWHSHERKGHLMTEVYATSSHIATVHNPHDDATEAEASAAFIVRACNSHEELLEALKALRAEVPDTPTGATIAKVDAAIQKARG